jgi:hypothetical protein
MTERFAIGPETLQGEPFSAVRENLPSEKQTGEVLLRHRPGTITKGTTQRGPEDREDWEPVRPRRQEIASRGIRSSLIRDQNKTFLSTEVIGMKAKTRLKLWEEVD